MATFGEAVRLLRHESHLSLRDLSDQAGIDYTYLSKIENGSVDSPSVRVVTRIAYALGKEPEEMLILAPKISQADIKAAINKDPRIGYLLQELLSGNLTSDQVSKMIEIVQAKKGDQDEQDPLDRLMMWMTKEIRSK